MATKGRYDIPKNLTRRERRRHIKKLTERVKKLKLRWDKLETWHKTLSQEDILKATIFEHEDVEINKKFITLATYEKDIVYYSKVLNKLMNYETKKPIVNGATEQISSV